MIAGVESIGLSVSVMYCVVRALERPCALETMKPSTTSRLSQSPQTNCLSWFSQDVVRTCKRFLLQVFEKSRFSRNEDLTPVLDELQL